MSKMQSPGFLLYQLEYSHKQPNLPFSVVREKSLPLWTTMTKHQRDGFRKRAEQIGVQNIRAEVTLKDQQDQERENEENERKKLLHSQVLNYIERSLADRKHEFVFLSVATFLADDYPGEMALAKWSKQGVPQTAHMRINPGSLPVGSAAEAKLLAEETHFMPIPPHAEGESDLRKVKAWMTKFIGDTKILFVHPTKLSELKAAENAINRIFGKSSGLIVAELSELLHQISPHLLIVGLARKLLDDKMSFSELRGVGCDYHNSGNSGLLHCSLSKINRWCEEMSDNVVEEVEIYSCLSLSDYDDQVEGDFDGSVEVEMTKPIDETIRQPILESVTQPSLEMYL